MNYEEMLREAFRNWNAGNLEASLEIMDPEIEWHTSGRFPDLELVYRGLDGVRRFWMDFRAPWDEVVLEPSDFVVAGDEAVVESAFRARARGDIEVDLTIFLRYQFRDGKVALVETHLSREAALEAAGIEPPAS